jgi:hypothetical protein
MRNSRIVIEAARVVLELLIRLGHDLLKPVADMCYICVKGTRGEWGDEMRGVGGGVCAAAERRKQERLAHIRASLIRGRGDSLHKERRRDKVIGGERETREGGGVGTITLSPLFNPISCLAQAQDLSQTPHHA